MLVRFLHGVADLASVPLSSKKWLAYQVADATWLGVLLVELWLTRRFADLGNNVALTYAFTLLYLTVVSKVALQGSYIFNQAWIDRYKALASQALGSTQKPDAAPPSGAEAPQELDQ